MLSTRIGPTPSIAVSSSADACSIRSRLPSARASAFAAVGPTLRMFIPTSTRARPRDFDASIASTSFRADTSADAVERHELLDA